MHVVVFEPDTSLHPAVARMFDALKPSGFSFELVTRLTETRELAEREPHPAAIIVSLPAPGAMRGKEGVRHSLGECATFIERFGAQGRGIPVVALLPEDDSSAKSAVMEAGAYDYLVKPVEPARLVITLRHALDHWRLLSQNREYRQHLDEMVSARTEMLEEAIAGLEQSYDITLEALGNALDLKDAETEGHSKRVTAFTIALARGTGLAPEKIRVIARGAYLHDIGKMAIPDAILLKPEKLQFEEQQIMREHCWLGYQILRKIPFLEEAAEIVYSHQEHYDGSGYPRGLKGEEIPLGARIFSIADTLDAITSDRPYRKAKSFAEARGEIARCANTQFDPHLVEAYLNLPDRIWEDLRLEITQQAGGSAALDPAWKKARKPFGLG